MGDEIKQTSFCASDFAAFHADLEQETRLLGQWLDEQRFSSTELNIGLELEIWLVDDDLNPAPVNDAFLKQVGDPLFSPELAKFNIEINTHPLALEGHCFHALAGQLTQSWQRANEAAAALDCKAVMIGILPTAAQADMTLANISSMRRYAAINEQIIGLRNGAPLKVNIGGREKLICELNDVMFESAATSLQLHLQVPADLAPRYYNASLILSAITVAVAANAPYLFGKNLWADTRIPLFEQAANVGGYGAADLGPIKRVSFGSGYVRQSITELFIDNLEHFPVLLPERYDEEGAQRLAHLRLHNGTIWRWNRPLVGFDADGTPHIRIEHRVMSAGPSLIDTVANAALFYGLIQALVMSKAPITEQIPFATARDNFYKAAQLGLDARVRWLDGYYHPLRTLILKELLGLARSGLLSLGVDDAEIQYYLGIIRARVDSGQNGAAWQRDFVNATSREMPLLLRHYIQAQASGNPVSQWRLPEVNDTSAEQLFDLLAELPERFFETQATELHQILPRPALIRIKGRSDSCIFVSILLHGNETSGFEAVKALLQKYQGQDLPRTLLLFVGNVQAARYAVRMLESQADYNRVWPGTELEDCHETQMMQQVFNIVRSHGPLLSVDIHNNTGKNPHYSCINRLDPAHVHLGSFFSRTLIYFMRPTGVQSMAMARLCPAVTLECGPVGDEAGIEKATQLLDACLHLAELPRRPVFSQDIDLYHTIARVQLNPKLTFGFQGDTLDVLLNPRLEGMNFSLVPANTVFACLGRKVERALIVEDEIGQDVFFRYFVLQDDKIRTRVPLIPSMLTQDLRVIEQDCLCYLMERFPLLI